jgi:hypothetical protein
LVKALGSVGVFLAALFGLFALGTVMPPTQSAKAVSDDGQAVLRFETPDQSPQINQTFSVKIMLDTDQVTATPTISYAEIQISFDKDKLELVSADVGADFDNLTPTPDATTIANANEEGKFPARSSIITVQSTGGLAPSDTAYEVLELNFKAKTAGTAQLSFVEENTTVIDDDNIDLLGTVQPASITIASAETPTAAPPTATVQPTPSQVPTAGPEDTIIGSWLSAALILAIAFAILRFRKAWQMSR